MAAAQDRQPSAASQPTSSGEETFDPTAFPPPSPPPPPATPAPLFPGRAAQLSGKFWASVIATLLMVVGGFGPWATALNLISVPGTRGDGWIVIGAAAVSAGALWSYARGGRSVLVWSVIAGLAGLGIGLIDLDDIQSRSTRSFFGEQVQLIQPAWGIYMVIIASAGVVLFSLLLWHEAGSRQRQPENFGG
jgi:hypothetical protein